MCGIVGIANKNFPVAQDLIDNGLYMLRHRGQESAGIVTEDEYGRHHLYKNFVVLKIMVLKFFGITVVLATSVLVILVILPLVFQI